ncbi:hypothetical protein AAC387_Pa01g3894 [Persea americana]
MSDNEMEEEKYAAFRAVFGSEEVEQPSRRADGEKEMEAPPHDNEMEEEIYAEHVGVNKRKLPWRNCVNVV